MGLGGAINKLTGASNSAKQNFRYQEKLANLNFAHQKEFAQNAHQWEMADLEKAGLNPALTTEASSAGSIAGGGSTGGGSGVGSSAASPLGLLSEAMSIYNQKRLTDAQIDNLDSQSDVNDSGVDKNNAGWLGNIIGAENASKLTKDIGEARAQWTASSAKRKERLDKRNKEENYLKKLLTFEIKKQKRK